jgi:hypothetical protein
MRKIVQFVGAPRVTAEPFFEILDSYFRELLNGNEPKLTKEVIESIKLWNDVGCSNCDGCLFSTWQPWVEALGTNAFDLCDLIDKIVHKKLKQVSGVDVLDAPWLRLSGSGFSKK